MQYRLIPAAPADEPWLEAVRRQVYAALFEATWGGWDEARHLRHFAACLARGGISIIEVEGVRVGMVQVAYSLSSVEVSELQIDPANQNRGIGTRVLTDILADARARGLHVHIKTGLKNDGAVRLYKRLGFRDIGRSETHVHLEYFDGRAHAE